MREAGRGWGQEGVERGGVYGEWSTEGGVPCQSIETQPAS